MKYLLYFLRWKLAVKGTLPGEVMQSLSLEVLRACDTVEI